MKGTHNIDDVMVLAARTGRIQYRENRNAPGAGFIHNVHYAWHPLQPLFCKAFRKRLRGSQLLFMIFLDCPKGIRRFADPQPG